MLSGGTHRLDIDTSVIHLSPEQSETIITPSRVKQGGLFSQKPYLACDCCNTGWMNNFEKQTLLFAKQLIVSGENIILTRDQARSLSCWVFPGGNLGRI
jgi:hypothetical protein